ncbi:ABC transporter permease [Amycolatopsis sp. NBC_01286]|uniref:ABC transporter permease n=1 Tax=Amycolatopsis sp. NBC_01286 TaxID=2903560 RepID=UPI002E1180BD|nr:ABC transporter permease [Amycolatopsis sp. NBC_01286]
MIWLTWRQYRRQAWFTLAVLGALAAIVIPTGLAMHAKYEDSGLAACRAALGQASMITQTASVANCESLAHQFQQQFGGMVFVAVLFVILPVLVGVFFGAPLIAREVEQGTHRLVWTQGVSRLHWALVKFGLIGSITAVLAVGYALGVSWWFEPLVSATGRLGYFAFDVQGVVPVVYTLFALALGIFAGTYWTKVLPAMGISLVGYAVVRVAIEVFARPRYLPAQTLTFAPDSGQTPNTAAGDWVMDQGVRNAAGDMVLPNSQIGPCGPEGCGTGGAGGPGAYNWLEYQPGDRFWTFQGIETGIFAVLTAALVYFAIRRVRVLA